MDGDLNVIWEEGAFPEIDILYQNITSTGGFGLEMPVSISSEPGYQFAPILIGNTANGLFGVYADQGTGSIDLKVQKLDKTFFQNGRIMVLLRCWVWTEM